MVINSSALHAVTMIGDTMIDKEIYYREHKNLYKKDKPLDDNNNE